jgi:hypothetical protein
MWLKHRWLRKLAGKRVKAGKWDLYIVLLDRFHLLPAEIDGQDPAFIDELLVFLDADAQHTRQRMKDAERT